MMRLDAARRLLHEAVRGITDLVERSHDQVAGQVVGAARRAGVGAEAEAIEDVRRAITWTSLAGVRGANALVRVLGDAAFGLAPAATGPAPLPPLRSDALSGAAGLLDGAVGAVNGIFGDGLVARRNALDLGMALRLGDALLPADDDAALAAMLGAALDALQEGRGDASSPEPARREGAEGHAAAPATGRRPVVAGHAAAPAQGDRELIVFVHGLSATEWSWCLGGATHWGEPTAHFATKLRAERGALPVYARYNTGRPVTDNGAALHHWLDRVMAAADAAGRPVERLVLVGHSMGGLVVRDAVARAVAADAPWLPSLKAAACLGSPHQGAPLERVAHALTGALALVPSPGAQVPATLLSLRSAGIRDLGPGDRARPAAAPWHGPALPQVPHLRWLLVATTLTERPHGVAATLLGDGLVPRRSATSPARGRPDVHVEVFGGIQHAAMQNHPKVYAALRDWLAAA